MTSEFEIGRKYEQMVESMRYYLYLGYGSIIFLFFFVIAEITNHSVDKIYTVIALFLFGLASLYLGYSEKKELKELKWKWSKKK